MGIEDILMHDESLFQNINAFDPDYMPPNYNFRDTQMEAMAMSIRPALKGGQPSNAIVLGSPATGKTTAMRKVFELLKKTQKKLFVFILTVKSTQHVLVYFLKFIKRYSVIYLRKMVYLSQGFIVKL